MPEPSSIAASLSDIATNAQTKPMRVLFALSGLHRVQRGAEVAFESVAREMAKTPGFDVTLVGSGQPRDGEPYAFESVDCTPREQFECWPKFPIFRSEYVYEEFSFVRRLRRQYDPSAFDVTITCSYPFTNWLLRCQKTHGKRPVHIFVTQNGDWPPRAEKSEFKWFSCDGLVCINPDYYDTHKSRWNCALISNGVNPSVFHPGEDNRQKFGLPSEKPIVLMVSALIPSKRVVEGVRSVAKIPDAYLVVAGDGPVRDEFEQVASELMPGRYKRVTLKAEEMPDLYRSADLFLHMSQDEPFGNVYIEALATGLPIVTHRRRVSEWTLENQAILVDTDDFDAVATGVQEGLMQNSDECVNDRRALAQRRFSWEAIGRQYCDFCESLVRGGANP